MPLDPVALAHDHSTAADFERAVLDGLDRALGFDAAFLVAVGEAPTSRAIDLARLTHALSTDAYATELLPLKTAATQRAGVAVDTALATEREVRARRYHRDFAAPVGGRHTLMAYLSLRGQPLGALMLGRSGRTFSHREVTALESLLPSLSVARASYRAAWRSSPLAEAPPASARERVRQCFGGARVLSTVDGDPALTVRDRGPHRELVAVSAGASMVWTRALRADPRRSGWFYVDLFHLAAARARERTRALFVGAGGAVAVRQFAEVYPSVEVDVVEPDPRVIDLASRWFGLRTIPRVTTHVADGVDFIARADRARWDVVVVDAFDAADSPRGFTTRAFVAGVRRALRRGGAAAFNTLGSLSGGSPVRAMERVARLELEDVRLVPVLDAGERFDPEATRNVVVVGSR